MFSIEKYSFVNIVFKEILKAFSETSTIVEFDTFKPLNFMEAIVPEITQVLIQSNHK